MLSVFIALWTHLRALGIPGEAAALQDTGLVGFQTHQDSLREVTEMGCELKTTEASPDWQEGMREGRPESRAGLCDTWLTQSGKLQLCPPCSLLQGASPQLL